jgi:hypothetical protein
MAEEGKAKAASYSAETVLRVMDGDGNTLCRHAESLQIKQKLLFVDGDGNRHMRLDRGKSTLMGHIDGNPLGIKSNPARTDFLVYDKEGNLLNALEIGRGIFIRGKDLGKLPRLEEMVTEGKTRVLKMKWPVRNGPVIPVTVYCVPEGRSGGEGNNAWKEVTFRLAGRTEVKGSIGGMLHLKGRGRMVVSKTDRTLVATDLCLESYLQQGDEVLARGEQTIRLHMEGDRFKDIPTFSMKSSAAPRRHGSLFSAAPSRFLILGFCLIGVLMGSFGYVCRSHRERYRRLERLTILFLIPGLLIFGISDSVQASSTKDIIWGAASIVGGALAGVGAYFALTAAAGLAFATVFAGVSAGLAVGFAIGGVALAVGAIALVGYGGYRIYKGIKGYRAKKKLAKDEDPLVRARAAKTLGEMGDKDNTVNLLNAMTDSDPRVRIAAAEALAELKDPAAYPVLAKLLKKETDPNVRAAIEKTMKFMEAAGITGGAGISERLRDLMDD